MNCTKKGKCPSKTKSGGCANTISKCEYKEGNNGSDKATSQK